ncbi:hypothetical protein [Acetonema longum]|uniref:hypothetical protein n=1 Tax=Acetonema longum TaxID=2374 RepID=UPI001930C9BF|nr:hypothetical protein [Acetonema longum]
MSGERFQVIYYLPGTRADAYARARDICLEQTVEFPEELLPAGFIRDEVVGRIENFFACSDGYQAEISFAAETAAGELTQLMNVMFGNISIKPGIRVLEFRLPPSLLSVFRGPALAVRD